MITRTRTTDGDLTLPRGGAKAPGLGALARRLRAWWARRPPAAPRRWDAARDATATFHPGPEGLTLSCRSGTFLVTQEGDPADHVLEPGEAFDAAPRGRVAAWALRAGALCVRSPRGDPPR